ncbi:phospholysine phosphohistidine inorganic pyrophosphate phosphatase-like [Saccostrea cucullata]|uniref:phospholysine phosphohistidine inorganic pyrophosphate phosphatase-like n=1 Tax=Saccostrea cuccullata TaxID=36930 RepID=UPI002ED3DC41
MASWTKRKVKGVLLDISGVLFESGAGVPIDGSVEAVQRLKAAGLAVRFCTNETTMTRGMLTEKLHVLGFSMSEQEIFPPIPAICKVLQKRNLRPHLLINPKVAPDFDGVDTSDPNCVILGDATTEFNYHNLNKAFQALVAMKEPVLFSLGMGRFYREQGELLLDVGPFTKALEFAADVKAEVVGKPSQTFFTSVLEDMNVDADNVVMVGDDIVSDVGGAQSCGMLGIQVRTGKFRPQDEEHPTVKPDAFADNLLAAVDLILEASK